MKTRVWMAAMAAVAAMGMTLRAQQGPRYDTQRPAVRFAAVDVYVDAGGRPLAAYQFELKTDGRAKIVGVEGGEGAFAEPPYYDPTALMNERIILAALDTGKDLPSGRVRVARVHLQIEGAGQPDYEAVLTTAADAEGHTIDAQVGVDTGESGKGADHD